MTQSNAGTRTHTRRPVDPSSLRGELGNRFLAALVSDFARNGGRAIQALRRQRRHDYLRLVTALLPKEFRLKEIEMPEMTDEELAELLSAVRAAIAEKGSHSA